MSKKSDSDAKYGDIYKNLNGLDLNLEDIGISYAFLKRANILTLQQVLSMNWDELKNIPGRSHIGIDHIVEKLQEMSEASGESKDILMTAVAVKYMKILGLSDEIIEAFEKRGEVKVSNQEWLGIADDDKSGEPCQIGTNISYNGQVFSLSVSEPPNQQIQSTIEKWGQYGDEHGLIYHVNRLEMRGHIIYTVFYVDTNADGWEKDEKDISNGEPWAYVSRMGDENWQWADYEKVSVKPVMGYVFRTDLPAYKEETLRFIKKYLSAEMREFLRSRPDIMNRTNCAKIVAFAPEPLELKIPALELIAGQTEPCPDDEDYDPLIAARAFSAALDERYENNPPGTVFMLQHRWFNEHDAPSLRYDYRGAWRLFTEFDAAIEYIIEERLPDLVDGWSREAWYEITKCVPGEYSEMDHDFSWVIDAYGEIWSFEGSTEFLQRHGFLRQPDPMLGETILDVKYDSPYNLHFCRTVIDIPTPFQPGDLVWIDCRPFSKKVHIVISSNDGESANCIRMYNEKVYSVFIEGISVGGRIKESMKLISPLYRAEIDDNNVHDVRVKGREYPAMKTISAAIKEKPEIGIEMEKYIIGDEPFHNYGGVLWEDFKDKFGLSEMTGEK